MGGKKKTKWRKLPLADFTKECSGPEKIVIKHDYKTDVTASEEKQPTIPLYEDNSVYQYNPECIDYTESMLYPTSYLLYNPVETAVFPNYAMPFDCYYYFTPEVPQMQEYIPMPYQEYIPPVKDTVHLLLPAPRSTLTFPTISYDWRNRRRRRRFEAEYAVIHDTNTFSNKEERDQRRKSVLIPNSGKNGNSTSNAKSVTLSSETSSNIRDNPKGISDLSPKFSSTVEEKRPGKKNMATGNEEKTGYAPEKEIFKPRKNQEFCGVHSSKTQERSITSKNKPESIRKKKNDKFISNDDFSNSNVNDSDSTDESPNSVVTPLVSDANGESKLIKSLSTPNDAPKNQLKVQTETSSAHDSIDILDSTTASTNTFELIDIQLSDSTKDFEQTEILNEPEKKESKDFNTNNEIESNQNQVKIENICGNLLNESTANNEILFNSDDSSDFNFEDETIPSVEKSLVPKSFFSQTYQVPPSPNYSSFLNETEGKHSTPLKLLGNNQTIYKFAYDENVTDQSNSPSPPDPETQVPSSITNSEIIIHEANSDSDAGSEDVELIPHRYESESSRNENKHVYVNKLSLAVELLRTQENLPYDDQFKRVVTENDSQGQVNYGFEADSQASYGSINNNEQIKTKQSHVNKHSDNGTIAAGTSFDGDESCELAKEAAESAISTERSDEVRENNRRFRVPFRLYFSPREALAKQLCCIIM